MPCALPCNADVVIGKFQRGMQLDARHVAADAIAGGGSRVGVNSCRGVVEGLALCVVVAIVVAAGILVSLMAGRAGEVAGSETSAFH